MGSEPNRPSADAEFRTGSRGRRTAAALAVLASLAAIPFNDAVSSPPAAAAAAAPAAPPVPRPPGPAGGLADDADAAAQPTAAATVGRLGTAAALRFTGNAAFTSDRLRSTLARDLEFELAAAPGAPLAAFTETVGRRVAAGYRNAGFPAAAAEVAVDRRAGAVTVAVTEGPRYWRGPVRVTGAVKTIPVDKLAERLTTRTARSIFRGAVTPAEGTIAVDLDPAFAEQSASTAWEVGAPTSFELGANRELVGNVRAALAELGYFRATFWIDTPTEDGAAGGAAPADGRRTTPLVIEVRSEGPRATVGSVDVTGLKANARAAVLKLAGLEPGRPVDLNVLRAAQQRLWDSARFRRHAVRGKCDPATGAVAVTLELDEVPGAPPVDRPLSDVQQAALRQRAWLLGLADGDEDLVLDLTQIPGPDGGGPVGTATVVAGFRRGFAVKMAYDLPFAVVGGTSRATAKPVSAPTTAPATIPATVPTTAPTPNGGGATTARSTVPMFDFAVALGGGEAAFFAPAAGLWGRSASPDGLTSFNLVYAPTAKPDGTAEWTLNVGAGVTSADANKPGQPPVRMNLGLAPAGFMDLAVNPDYTSAIRDGVLTVQTPRFRFRSDAATGRLIEAVGLDVGPGMSARAWAERGAMDRVRRQWRALVPADRPPAAEGFFGAAARAAVARLLARPDVDPPTYARAAAALDRLLDPSVVGPAVDAVTGLFGVDPDDPDGSNKFVIPTDPTTLRRPAGGAPFGDLPILALPYTNELFARSSWPWVLSRQTILQLAGRGDDTVRELYRLHRSGDVGPVGSWAVAEWAARQAPPVRQAFAQLGLERLSAERFARDLSALTGGDWPAAEVYRRLAGRLRDLPPADVEALAVALRPGTADALRAVAADLRALPRDTPVEDAAAVALARRWEAALRAPVAARLRELAE